MIHGLKINFMLKYKTFLVIISTVETLYFGLDKTILEGPYDTF